MPSALDAPVMATHRVRGPISDDHGIRVEPTGRGVERSEPQCRAAVVRREPPRRDVGVVVEPGADDLVAGLPIAARAPG